MTPYQLVYGKTCHLPVKLEFKAHWAITTWRMDFPVVGIKRQMQLVEIDEWKKKHTTAQRYTRKEPRDGMISASKSRSSHRRKGTLI
jgi:hypothetical protein